MKLSRKSSPRIRIFVRKLRTTPATREDIRSIQAYSKSRFGSQTAAEYLAGLSAIFDLLEVRPLAGTEHANLAGIRSFRYRSHRIYYRLDDQDLLVVRILHHARDVAGAFGPDQ